MTLPTTYLVPQHELSHYLGAVDIERAVAGGDPGDGVYAVHRQRVEKVEFKGRDSRRFDNHVERAGLFDRMVRHLSSVDIAAADAVQPPRSCRVGVDDVEAEHLGVAQAQRQCREQTDWAESSHEAAFPRQPVERGGHVRQPRELQVHGFRDRFFGHRERLGEHAHRFELRRYAHGERLSVDHEFGLVSVEAPDATLGVQPRPAHIGLIHGARPTRPAAAADGEGGVVAGLDQRHRAADVHDLAEDFVAEHEVLVRRRRLGEATGGLFPVGATDAHPHHFEFDVVRRHDRRFRPVDELDGRCSRDDGDGFHARAFRRSR